MRKEIQTETLEVNCPVCFANKNRRCIRTTSPDRGQAMKKQHQKRVDAYLKYEIEQNQILSEMPFDKISLNMIVRCVKTGVFGKILHIHTNGEPAILISWKVGGELRIQHKDAKDILHWKKELFV